MPAMGARHQLATIGERVAVVVLPAKKNLHPFPGRPVDQRFLLAWIPLALVQNLADIGPVLEDVMDRASWELSLRRSPEPAFGVDPLDYAIERQVFVGVEVEDAAHVGRSLHINFNDAPPILTDVAVAVRSQSDEPALLHATGQS